MTLASDLGWEVSDIVTRKASLGCPVIMRAVDRIGAFRTETTAKRKTDSPFAIVPRRLSLLANRAGDCDCGGGECCGALCEGAIGGCDCGAGGCDGGNCCDCNGDGIPDCLRCCDLGSGCDACCDCGSRKEKANSLQAAQTDPNDPLIGQVVETATPLKPTGFIRVEGRKIPAKIETGMVNSGEKVVIIRKGNFGYIVEHQSDSE